MKRVREKLLPPFLSPSASAVGVRCRQSVMQAPDEKEARVGVATSLLLVQEPVDGRGRHDDNRQMFSPHTLSLSLSLFTGTRAFVRTAVRVSRNRQNGERKG